MHVTIYQKCFALIKLWIEVSSYNASHEYKYDQTVLLWI